MKSKILKAIWWSLDVLSYVAMLVFAACGLIIMYVGLAVVTIAALVRGDLTSVKDMCHFGKEALLDLFGIEGA